MPAPGSISSERAAGEVAVGVDVVEVVATSGDPAPHPAVPRRIDKAVGASHADLTRELWTPPLRRAGDVAGNLASALKAP